MFEKGPVTRHRRTTHAHLAALLIFPDLPATDDLLSMLRLSVDEVALEHPEELLAQAHGGRQGGHGGVKRTYDKLLLRRTVYVNLETAASPWGAHA